jgi:lipoprotein-anchoring transpeptidase ErfK/SrfK
MNVRRDVRLRPHAWQAAAVAAALTLVAAGCTSADEDSISTGSSGPGVAVEEKPPVSAAIISTNVRDKARGVPVDTTVQVSVEEGTLSQVRLSYGPSRKALAGTLSGDKSTWTAEDRLEPGLRYRITATAVDEEGLEKRTRSVFRTDGLTLDEQTYPSIAPLAGETVGVGMPVIVKFDVAVTDRASIEKHLSVDSSPHQVGAWHWLSDNEVHWRPKRYWKPGTQVTVTADINSIPAGGGIYGQLSRSTTFTVGDAVVSRVDVERHVMRTYVNGSLARTIPVSAGKPGFITRSGTKVIIEKFRQKRMDAATTGIDRDDPEYYNIANVEYAMRVTYSGEFLHAAPWSVGSQGSANVSHGCVGMSTENAAWLYNLTKRGDVVEVTGSDRYMTLENGFGDWNLDFEEYKAGSAIS